MGTGMLAGRWRSRARSLLPKKGNMGAHIYDIVSHAIVPRCQLRAIYRYERLALRAAVKEGVPPASSVWVLPRRRAGLLQAAR